VDIDGDGDLDAFVGNSYGNTLYYLNTGTANSAAFSTPQTNPFGLTNVGSYSAPTLVDIDGDGDLDAFVGNNGGNTQYYENTGTANSAAFSTPQTNPFGLTNVGTSSAPTFVDIDGDGDLDAFVGNSYGNTLYYLNTGTANSAAFSTPQTNPFGLTDVGNYSAPTLVDIDGDGDLDAFVGNNLGNIRYFQNGNDAPTAVTLTNTTITLPENTDTTSAVKVADIAITDDGLGTNTLSLSGADAGFFEIIGNALYIKAGTTLDFETKTSYSLNVEVDDTTVGTTPDVTTAYTLSVTDVNEGVAVNINGTTNNYSPISYDRYQDITGTFTISGDATEVEIQGNTWKKLDIGNYTITNNTLLTFDYQNTGLGEIQGIGFETNDRFIVPDDAQNLFQLAGSQNIGRSEFNNYSTGSGWQSYSISVGDYLSGTFNYLTLVNDDDVANPLSNSVFRNIELSESNPQLAVNINGTTNNYTPTSYDRFQDITGAFTISADETEVEIQGNTWKKLDIGNYTITLNTLLTFEYQSTGLGEIQGIGFETNNRFIVPDDAQNLFQLAGSQNIGRSEFNNYSTGSGWQSYSISVGDHLSGTFNYLTLVNDDDVANPLSNGSFRNITLSEVVA
jgi:hypothetical protein